MYKMNNRGPSTDPYGTEQKMTTVRDVLPPYTRREMFYPTGKTGNIPVRKPNWRSSLSIISIN